jgi:hypothetical protein
MIVTGDIAARPPFAVATEILADTVPAVATAKLATIALAATNALAPRVAGISMAEAIALAARAAAVVPIVGWIAIAISLATFLGGAVCVIYRTAEAYHKLIDSTNEVLNLAIKEVLKWQCSTAHEDNNTEGEESSKEKKLELLGKYENLTRSSKCCVLQRCLAGGISMLV